MVEYNSGVKTHHYLSHLLVWEENLGTLWSVIPSLISLVFLKVLFFLSFTDKGIRRNYFSVTLEKQLVNQRDSVNHFMNILLVLVLSLLSMIQN